ncbi:mercuric transport protein periplasmic protein [Salinisphaera shabanensis T35B1]|uniref:Cation transporter n=1 Tax=Salinisphaera aquimarina TaxID=2094031 RepID=A0ABV7ELR3_9GAMM
MVRKQFISFVAATLLLGMFWTQGAVAAVERSVTLAVQHMTCATCPLVVRKALQQVNGVRSARVDYQSKTAAVVFDPAVASVSDLTAATTRAGYPSKPKEQAQ